MRVRVRNDLVFVKPEEKPTVSEGGIHMVHANQRRLDRGVVVALGDGPVTAKGVRLPHICEVGDRVIFSPDSGEELAFEKEVVIAMREEQILAIVLE